MSLRLRLFFAFALLLAAFATVLLVGLLRLNRDLNTAFGESAVAVGHTIVTVLSEQSDGKGPVRRIERRIEQRSDANGVVAEDHSENVFVLPGPHDESAAEQPDADDAPRMLLEFKTEGDAPAVADIDTAINRLSIKRLHVDDGSQALWVSGDGIDEAIPLPKTGLDRALLGYSENLLWAVLGLLVLGLLAAFWLAHRITAPLRGLGATAGELANGHLGAQAPVAGSPEVRDTISTFNRMSTQLAELEQQAEQLRQRRALTELGEIGRGLAHALRNPLHAVGLALEELADRAGDGDESRTLKDTARAQLKRVDAALRSFLALAAGEAAVETDVDLRGLVEDVLLEASQSANGDVGLDLQDGESVPLRGVPAELRILLHTLVVNAVEASPAGGRVEVAVQAEDDGARIMVRDHGFGIANDIRERLFEPHVSSKPDGAGMGLYLARRIASLRYAGDIELADRDDGGCEAVLRLHPRSIG
ncbi:MAG: HAMP domain-containing histidine kinase [Xanthomonadales bacterium]|nr:HAMP domain-containing histidine kinase [Xanthomonadales bacterium]